MGFNKRTFHRGSTRRDGDSEGFKGPLDAKKHQILSPISRKEG
jgi:hypothetical protein